MKFLKAPNLKTLQDVGIFVNVLFVILLPFSLSIHLLYGLLIGWMASVIGANFTAHRVVTHKHYQIPNWVKTILLFVYNCNAIGSIVIYASQHMRHHQYTGTERDPHNPNEKGFLRTHFRFYGDRSNTIDKKIYKKMISDKIYNFYHKYYWLPIISYSAIIALFFPITSLYYYIIAPLVVTFHLSQIQVTLTHLNIFGSYQNYTDTGPARNSYNNKWLKPFLLGEELHNNHHRYPGIANQGSIYHWYDIDVLHWISTNIFKVQTT